MRQSLKGVYLIGLLCLLLTEGFAQTATVVNSATEPKHETFSQRQISVLFDDGVGGAITLMGSTAVGDWDVKINGTSVAVTAAVILSNRVTVTFNATALNGVTYLLPGQTLTVSFTNSGTLLTTGSGNAAADFTDVPSKNNFAFTCTELIFFKQEAYASVDVCSPVVMDFYQYAYKLSLRYRNSSNFDINDFDFNVIWGDGNTEIVDPYLSDPAGVADPAYFDNTGFTGSNPAVLLTARPTHTYPDANPTDCSFNFSLVPSVGGSICNSISTTTLFATYDNDNENSGALSLQPEIAGTDRVCLGSNVDMRFSDQTQLNCRAAIEPILPNDQARYIRIVYGSSDFDAPAIGGIINNIPDIHVGGVPVTQNDAIGTRIFAGGYFPTGAGGVGVPDFNGVIEVPSPVTAATAVTYMEQITTTQTNLQQEFQRFYVRIDYWDVCNPYDPSDLSNAVSIENYVEIISTPPSPGVLTTARCETEADANFDLTATGVAGTYNWYKELALTTNLQTGADNTFNPVSEGPMADRIIKAVLTSTVFHRYVTVTTANGCTSLPTDISIQIDDTNLGGTIGHPLGVSPITICNGTDPAAFTSVADATGGNGIFNYQWEISTTSAVAGFANIGGATASTFDPGVINTRTWFRRRASSGACADVFSNVIEFVTYVPTATVTGGGSVCSGTPATDITWTLTGVAPFNFTIDLTPGVDIVVNNLNSTTYTIDDPSPGVDTDYELVSLTDNNGCPAVATGGVVQVTIQSIAPPSVDAGGFTTTPAVCEDVVTDPPDAVLDLLPNSVETYNISYKLRNNSTLVEANFNIVTASDANGVITISPTYADMGNAPLAAGYQIIITGIFNTATLCTGAVPINGPNLIVNPRPSTASGAINAAACATPGNGAALRVADPDPTNTLNLQIAWSTMGPARAVFLAVNDPFDGTVGGTHNNSFTPATSATGTFYAFVTNTSTGCLSNTGLAVTQTQETMPTGDAGLDQPGLCIDNPAATLAATSGGGVGSWSVPGVVAYYQNFEGFANGTTTSTAANGWTIDTSLANAFSSNPSGSSSFQVNTNAGNRVFEGNDLNGNNAGAGEVVWQSPVIDISGMSSVQAAVNLIDSDAGNTLEAADYIRAFYRLNGAAEVQFATNGNMSNDFAAVTATAFVAGTTGMTLQIVIRMSTDAAGERYAFDNVIVNSPTSNITFNNPNASNAVVSNLPVPGGAAPVTTTLRWTVTSALGACVLQDDVNLTVNVLPTSVAIAPVLCEDVAGTPPIERIVDLSTYNTAVTDGATVEWFNNALRTAPFLVSAPLSISDGQTFYWRSTNAAGCANIGQVTFTIESLPQATAQAYEFCEDVANNIDLTAFEVDITTGAVDVEWFEDDGFGGLGAPIDNPATPLVNEETEYDLISTRTLYARVTNSASAAVPKCENIASVVMTFKPRPQPNTISGDNILCAGSAVEVYQVNPATNAYGAVHQYLWTLNGTTTFDIFQSGSGFTSTVSHTDTNNDFILIARFPNAGTFTLTVTEIIDGCSGDVATFNLTVAANPPALAFQAPDLDVCKNETVAYSLTTTNPLSTYNWTVVGGNVNGASNGVALTNVSITWGTATLPQPSIMVQETSQSGCSGTPATTNINIQDIPVVTQNLDKIVCNNEASGIVFSTTGSSAAAAMYNIISIVPDAGLTTTANLNPRNVANVNEVSNDRFQNASDDPLNVRYSIVPVSAANCSGAVEEIVLTVEPQVTANITNSTPAICSSTTVQVTLQSSTNPSAGDISFNYTANASSGLISGFQPVQNNLPVGTIINHNVTNNDNQPQTLTYTITPIAQNAKLGNGCSGSPVIIPVSIEPKPKVVITPNTAAVCEEVPLAFALTSSTVPSSGAVVFRVTGTPVATGGVSGASPDATQFANGELLDDILLNPTVSAQTVLYRLTPVAPAVNCSGDYAEVTVTVNPKPIVTPASTLQTICSGSTINIALAFDVPNSSSTWTVAPDPNVLGASAGGGALVFQSLFNTSTTSGSVVYSVVPMSPAGCPGNPQPITINVNPSPEAVVTPASETICTGETTSIALTSAVAGTTFSWTVNPSATSITGAANATGNTISQTLTNTGLFPGTAMYTITPRGPAPTLCVGNPKTAIVTIAPPVDGRFMTTDVAICNGSSQFVTMFFDGQAPFTATLSDGNGNTTLSNVGNFYVQQLTPTQTTTYSILSVRDVNGCVVPITDEHITITVSEADAGFSVLTAATCTPSKTSFQYNEVAGVTYTWKWFDGAADSVYTAAGSNPTNVVSHRFVNPSPTGTFDFPVSLTARVAPALGSCSESENHTVSVFPRVSPNVFPNKTVICSGETVEFSNQAFGASTHRWFYREVGSSQELDIKTTVDASFRLINETAQNPMVYEVVYRGANSNNCPGEKVIPITVYRGAAGVINEGTIPPYVGGQTIVTYTNGTNPLDGSDFRYDWEFGSNSNPATFSGANATIAVTYTSPGIKRVVLRITNLDAQQCVTTVEKNITILLPPLVAGFNIFPYYACYPADIAVTENTSTGDIFSWQVIERSGSIAATALSPQPTFRINSPGVYDVILETRNSITGQSATHRIEGIEVFGQPNAIFETRPTTVFVPDGEVVTFNRSSNASFYEWNFGDGSPANFDPEPKHEYAVVGTYTITLIAGFDHQNLDFDKDGDVDGNLVCADTTSVDIKAQQGGSARVPNAFTPGLGGPNNGTPGPGTVNDVFLPLTDGVNEFHMQIYDRWGNLLFESKDKSIGWDGYDRNKNLLPAGVYVFKLEMLLSDGNRTTQVGDVTLIR